jgi:predicted nucleotidyltransferase
LGKNKVLYGLKPDTIAKIYDVFKKYENIEEVILYGSRAKGTFRDGSDIDLTVKGKNIHVKMLNKIIQDLDDLLLPYTFDLSIYDHIKNPDLLAHIKMVGVGFYTKNSYIDGKPFKES